MIEEKVLELAKKISVEADISIGKRYSSSITYKSNEIDTISSNEAGWISLRIIKDGKLGISYSYDLKTKPDKLLNKALVNSKYGPVCHFKLPEKVTSFQQPKSYDPKIVTFKTSDAKKIAEAEMQKLLAKETDLLVSSGVSTSHSESRFLNTNGTDYSTKKTNLGYYILGQRNSEGDFLRIASDISSRKLDEDLTKPQKTVANLFDWSKKLVEVKTGKFDVYLEADVFIELLRIVLTALNGKNVLMGSSFLKDSLGKTVFDKRLQITEDPFIDWGRNPFALDGEGTKTSKKALVKNGTVNKFVYDLETASRAKAQPTGNGFRGIVGQARPRFTNILIAGGEKSEDDILKNIKNGLYVKSVMGAHTNDPYSGNLSLQGALVFRIRDGKIEGRVKNTMLFLNVFEALKSNLVELSSERRWEGNYFLPGVYLKDISIASK